MSRIWSRVAFTRGPLSSMIDINISQTAPFNIKANVSFCRSRSGLFRNAERKDINSITCCMVFLPRPLLHTLNDGVDQSVAHVPVSQRMFDVDPPPIRKFIRYHKLRL